MTFEFKIAEINAISKLQSKLRALKKGNDPCEKRASRVTISINDRDERAIAKCLDKLGGSNNLASDSNNDENGSKQDEHTIDVKKSKGEPTFDQAIMALNELYEDSDGWFSWCSNN